MSHWLPGGEWYLLITSELAKQHVQKVLFMCAVHTNYHSCNALCIKIVQNLFSPILLLFWAPKKTTYKHQSIHLLQVKTLKLYLLNISFLSFKASFVWQVMPKIRWFWKMYFLLHWSHHHNDNCRRLKFLC